MKVPLCLDTYVYEGIQKIKIWSNGKCETINSEIKPYCYTISYIPNEAKVTPVNKRLLYDKNNTKQIYKLEFNTINQLKDCCNSNEFFESKINFRDRIFTDCPELVEKYANTEQLKVMYFDIETDSFQTFPTASENAIIAIGCQVNDKPIQILMSETYNNDKEILQKFCEIVEKEDVDVYVGYNSSFFDWNYIFERMKINKLDISIFSRDGSQPYIVGDNRYIKFGGRVHLDLYTRGVLKDQNLFKFADKLTDKGLKTISKLYGLQDVIKEPPEIMANMRSIVNTQQLHDYLTSDIRATHFVSDIYFPAIIKMAEYLGTSLEAMINSSPAYMPHILLSKHYSKIGIVSEYTVGEKYPEIVEGKMGALVGSFYPGIYKQCLRKFDIASDYPNILRSLNLSPETTEIICVEDKLKPFTANMDHDKKYLTISIPDYNLKKQLVIGIDFNTRGYLSEFVDSAFNDRLIMKQKMKTLSKDSQEYANLDVNQLLLKVLMNSATGYAGQSYSIYGSLGVYCCITGVAREIITQLINHVGKTIALDTDGIVISSDDDIDETNMWLENYMLTTFGIPKNYMKLEEEPIYAAYFRPEKKQYLVLEKDENTGEFELTVHGIGMKGSQHPRIFSNIITKIGKKMLLLDDSDNNALKEFKKDIATYYDQSNWTLNSIKKRIKVKPIETYKSANTIGMQLVEQYEKKFKTKIKNETQLEYVKIKSKHGSQYQLVTIFDQDLSIDIDYDYYTEIVDSAFKRLDLFYLTPKELKKGKQKSIFDF